MLFGDLQGMSIRKLIEDAFMRLGVGSSHQVGSQYRRWQESLGVDGNFENDRFRQPTLMAIMRRDYQAAVSLSKLSMFNVAWLALRDKEGGEGGKALLAAMKTLDFKSDINELLPIETSQFTKEPKTRGIVNELIKDGWLIHVGDVRIASFHFAVFHAATAPMKKRFNQPPEKVRTN